MPVPRGRTGAGAAQPCPDRWCLQGDSLCQLRVAWHGLLLAAVPSAAVEHRVGSGGTADAGMAGAWARVGRRQPISRCGDTVAFVSPDPWCRPQVSAARVSMAHLVLGGDRRLLRERPGDDRWI